MRAETETDLPDRTEVEALRRQNARAVRLFERVLAQQWVGLRDDIRSWLEENGGNVDA